MKLGISKAGKFLRYVMGLKRTEKNKNPLAQIGRFQIRCNLCGKVFRAKSHFLRFCKVCKIEDESFRFAEWMST